MLIWRETELLGIRRKLHEIPEIGLKEYKTHQFLLDKINELPQDKLTIYTKETAILVKVKGNSSQKTFGWRTDIDALPISEETALSFSSTHEGTMHACGHDIHMTIALGVLQEAIFSDLDNDCVFFFQPAEENHSGAKIYYDNGFLTHAMPDELFALHINPTLPVGTIGCLKGTMFSGDCCFKVIFNGKEGHAAYPHNSNDMIIAATSFVQQVQTIISRNVDPMVSGVISFGEMFAGKADNIIAGQAILSGSIRALNHEVNDLLLTRMQQIADGVALTYQCEVTLNLDQKGYLPVVNDDKTTSFFIDVMNDCKEVNYVTVREEMTAEDFGYLIEKIPGTMFWLGVDSPYGLHHSKLNPDEASISFGINAVSTFLNKWDKK